MQLFAYSHTEAGIRKRASQFAVQDKPKAVVRPPKPILVGPPPLSNVIELSPESNEAMAQRGMPRWAREITMAVALEHNVAVSDMMGSGRYRNMVLARREAWYLLKTGSSPINGMVPSYMQIAEWFGREHTGILHNVARYVQENGLPLITRYDITSAMARKRKRARCQKRSRAKSSIAPPERTSTWER